MTWNYRVVRDVHTAGEEEYEDFSIREVYYREDGSIQSWTARACSPGGETWLELFDDHARMGRAFNGLVVDVSSGSPVEVGDHAVRRGCVDRRARRPSIKGDPE